MLAPGQFTVPQFIDAEDKIIGPITLRQFIIMTIAFMTTGLFYQLFRFVPFILMSVPLIILAGVLAFVKINGQSFHYFILNIVQTFRRPGLRVWDKKISEAELRLYISKKPEKVAAPRIRKPSPGATRLKELSLLVNTGGTYNPEKNI